LHGGIQVFRRKAAGVLQGRGDLLIASIALAFQAILVTRNTKDFQRIGGLRVENWAD
jgi:tRNA(fMet)-specific endonuclease VapC